MAELITISYEEYRRMFFEEQLKKAHKRMQHWDSKVDRTKPYNPNSIAYEQASKAGSEVRFFQDALEALAAQPKWISVEERLPEERDASVGGLVLCICADDDGRPYAEGMHAWHYTVVARHSNCFTHWMPLPSTEGLNVT